MKQRLPGYLPRWSRTLVLALLVGSASAASAQKGPDSPYFQPDVAARQAATASPLAPQLRQYQAYTLDLAGLRQRLAGARLRGAGAALTLSLPQPDGTSQRFAVWEAPLLAPALAAQHPTVRTYGGQGIDDPTARLSLTVSPAGLLAQILTQQPGGAVYLEAVSKDDTQHIISYYAQDVLPATGGPGACGNAATLPAVPQPPAAPQGRGPNGTGARTNVITQPIGPTLTVYRLIVTTTKEYGASVHSAANGTDSTDVLTNVTALVNNVRAIQERDLAVTMSLVNYRFYNNTLTGNYDQTSDMQMIQQNRINVERRYGAGAFDLAHLFASSSSGLAYVGVIANPATASPYSTTTVPTTGPNLTYKAGALSGNGGRSTPIAYFSTSVIAHEMGHQFGATHTFNGGCAPNRSVASAWEPGSGSTIMSYADVGCGTTIESRADSYYHAGSIDQMRTYVESITAAYSAGTTFGSDNTPPVVSVPASKTIPQGTPFKLVATATDVNTADVLNYNWEELDTGSLADVMATQVANDNFPLFRSILPSTGGATRYFPRLGYLGGSPTASTNGSERLPTVARALNFKCTVRDYHTGTGAAYNATASGIVGGVTESSLVTLTVSAANSTPFAVTAPNTAVKWVAGSTQTITWNGVGTKSSAVNCQTVNIRLSTDGGATYPTVLLSGAPNVDGTGTASIAVPANLNTTTARIMVEAADNYFFDISDTNFTITTGPVALSLSPARGPVGTVVTIIGDNFGSSAADLGVTFTSLTGTVAATIGTVNNGNIQVTVPAAALTGPVVMTRTGTAAGTSSPGSFSVTPVLSSTNPTAGAEGSAVTLSGTGLGNALRVSFNGVVVQSPNFTSTGYTAQPNTITVNVPFGATSGPVTVTTAGGVSNAVSFTVTSFTFSPLALSPPSGAGAASEASNIVATLNGAPNASAATTAPLKVSSLQAGGRRAGTTTVSGNTIVFDPTTNFRAGEVVQVTLTTAATTGTNTALARPYVGQYTTRTRPATALGTSVDYTVGVGTRPESIVAGNLNADVALDLVMVNRTSSTVSVMLNNGTGTGFVAAAGSPIAVGTTPLHAVLADLNNDGNLDLLVTCSGGTINVLQGNGDGTFTAQASITGLGAATMTAVGDLNGDGNLDLVTAISTTTLARAVIGLANTDASGNGNFTFATSQYNGLEAGPQAVVLADFNEDGRLDLASGNYTAGTVSVRLGNGAGAFSGTASLAATGINYLVTADLTGDGHLDLASVNTFDATNGRPVLVWVGAGDGTFATPAIRLTPAVFAYTLSTGDYNGDGVVDLMTARAGSTTGGVDIFSYNPASASFTGPITKSAIGNQPRNVAVADINNDQTLDFVTANSVGGNSFSTALGTAGTPLAVAVPSVAATAPAELQVYPNPARGTITVELSKGATAAPLLLLNALGQAVLSRPALAAGQAAQLSLAGLAPGLYVVRCGTLAQRLTVE